MKGKTTSAGLGGLAFFFLLALWAIVGHFVNHVGTDSSSVSVPRSEAIVPPPVSTEEWSFHLGGAYGTGDGQDGVRGLEFFSDARSPYQFINPARTYIGNQASGTIMPTSAVSASAPFTFTAGLNDTDAAAVPDRFTLSVGCPVVLLSIFVDYVDITGVVTSVDCGLLHSGPCKMAIRVDTVNGLPCP